MTHSVTDFQPSNIEQRTLALAAVCQSAYLSQSIALGKKAPALAYQTSLSSILVMNPEKFTDIYPDVAGLKPGLEYLTLMYKGARSAQQKTDFMVMRYIMGLMQITNKVSQNSELMNNLRNQLEQIQRQRVLSSSNDWDSSASRFAQLYQDIFGQLKYRILIHGSSSVLSQTEVANNIRSLLLAGVRATLLWRQLGGKQWQLLLTRGKIVDHCEKFLNQIRQKSNVRSIHSSNDSH
ncbi:MAG: high frequency lysogenization protein HflD [Pseudomonadota bacterium]